MRERTFECSNPWCNRKIHFGDTDAVTYDNEMFCCEECVLRYLEIEAYPWEYEARYEFESSEENGFLICAMNDDFFTNGHYVIWDKCKLSFDFNSRDYQEQVYLNRSLSDLADNVAKLHEEFKRFELKPLEIDFSKLTEEERIVINSGSRWSYDLDVLGFILNYICLALSLGEFGKEFAYIPSPELPSNLKRFNVAIDEEKGRLFIEREGIKAVLTGWPVNERAADF